MAPWVQSVGQLYLSSMSASLLPPSYIPLSHTSFESADKAIAFRMIILADLQSW
jgi:hypothetical protein